jgi:excisionase family DNA binding protein
MPVRAKPEDWLSIRGVKGRRYTPAEVAVSLGVAYATVLEWLKVGYLRGTRTWDGRWMVRCKAVRRALRDCRHVASAVARAQRRQ